MKKLLFLPFLLVVLTVSSQNRQLTVPEASQAASVMQRIGLTEIVIHYHSPLAKDRTIWGDVVPYNEVWRAGANENTTISFSTDIQIEGRRLPAGIYGLHMIPTQKEWTIIFNKNAAAWGSFFYDDKDDALRITVQPKTVEMNDWLSYSFTSLQPRTATIMMHWEKLAVPINVSVDVPETVFNSMKKELTNMQGFFWEGFNQAANYCVQNNIHLDEASVWVDKSIQLQKNFANLNTKSKLLAKQGKPTEADAMKKDALALADENQLNNYGYELLGQGKNDDAMQVFKMNTKKYPASWNVYDSLAEAQEKSGDKKNALSNYKTALTKAPDNQKKRLETTIKKLEAIN